ncbi:hypothetical protein [Methanosarcina sp. 2.H.A.1B.4]|uniref:hypothetical protein n=1 Tax=Methanosarcina sp. 2.H.A.1B.4 TaxID=1483600 RepID=UPI000621FDF7|nr:hypothetical protein [Methanosarcina sp. 2.H.A.1B.4]KKG07730.1 hypothetical protein EO92_04025 [Methanosarcina sp. 2.H.A.1B.4]
MKFGISALVIAVLLAAVFFAPTEGTQKAADKGEEEEETEEKPAYAPWFNEGDPWFAEGDELNRLSTDELRALAEQNETVRKMLEEDQKLEPVRIESLEDIEHLPENYPEELKRQMIEDYLARQNLSEQQNNSSDDFPEPPAGEVNEPTTNDANESTTN